MSRHGQPPCGTFASNRYYNTPETRVNSILLTLNENDNDEPSFWKYFRNGVKNVDEKSRRMIVTYLPMEWHESALNLLDIFSKFIGHFQNFSMPIRNDEKGMGKNCLNWFTRITFIGLVLYFILFLHSLAIIIILKLLLPFYAIFTIIYWLILWKLVKNDSTPLKLVDQWSWIVLTIETVFIFIKYIINNKIWNEWESDWINWIYQCLIPVIVFGIIKFHSNLGWLEKPKLNSDQIWFDRLILSCICLIFTYIIRYFSVHGFILVPFAFRPFLGYAACISAIFAFQRTTKKISHHCNGTVMGSNSTGHSRFITNSPQKTQESEFLRLPITIGPNSRRVSLPAGTLVAPNTAQSNISEARGLIADMLAQKELPAQLVSGLKAVSTLLLPAIQSNNFELSPRFLDASYLGAGVETVGQRRQSPIVVTWSTTTSATGLPTVEPEPSRARSSIYWKQRQIAEDDQNPSSKNTVTPQHSLELNSGLIQVSDGTLFSLTDIEGDKYLSHVHEWPLQIFDLYNESPDTVLSRMAYAIFKQSDFFRLFKISKQKFFSFFHTLEQGYWEIPYHNRIHAADVMHASYYLAINRVPAISDCAIPAVRKCENGKIMDEGSMEKVSDENANGLTRPIENMIAEIDEMKDMEKNVNLTSVLSSLELMALYTAGAMHDYDHPGRTNAFLVAIEDKKAILYNDRSVLENHHAAASWQLLTQNENNFIEHLDAAEFKRFRYMVIEAILATDLKRHFEILMDFNTKVNSCGLDWDNESDKLLTCQICIKMADINSPTKPFSLHSEWTRRIVEEFYAQGDEEGRLCLPVSPYMNRQDPQLASLQDSFITHLVSPLAQAMHEAGLLPITQSQLDKPEVLVNLEHNQKYWKNKLKGEMECQEDDQQTTEMEPIQEQDENGIGHIDGSHKDDNAASA